MSYLTILIALLVPVQLSAQALPTPAAASEELLLQAAANVRLGYSAPARAILTGLVVPPDHPEWEAVRKLLLCRAFLLEGDGQKAATLCESLIGLPRPGLSKLARFHLARALHHDGKPAAALPHLDELWKGAEDGAFGPKLCRAGFESALASGDEEQTTLWLKRLGRCKGVDKSEVLEAKILHRAARAESTNGECRELYTQWPCATLPAPCLPEELGKELKYHEHFDRAVRLFECWGYVEAATIFEQCLAEPAWSRHHNRCHFYLAEIHSRKLRDDRAKALEHYRHVYKHGGGAKHSALYQMGRCKMNLEKYDEALAIFEDYIDRYPDGAHAERCHYYLGWLPYDHDELDAAMPGFDRYLKRYRKGELRTYILWFKAWSLYRLQRYKEATKVFMVLSKYGNDIVAGKAYYWLGRIASRQEQIKRAREWFEKSMERYPLSYYGMLSWHRLHEIGGAKDNPLYLHQAEGPLRPLPSQLGPLVTKRLQASLQPAMDAVLVGEMRAARAWFAPHRESFERAVGANNVAAHYWLFSILEEPASMRTWGSKHNRQRGKLPTDENRSGWTFAYPQAYLRLIEVQAEQTGLPPWFLYSIMRQESRYRRGVVSWADAVGLLQVIPPTGKRTADRLGIPFDRFNLSDPAVNLRLGTSYLGFLAKDFHRQLTLVAASYNAGPDPIRTFVRENLNGGWDYVIEEIAYNEARNYCRKVTGHVLKYLATYAPLRERQLVFPLLFPQEANFEVGSSVDY
jgi:soluble lytic murein transglycosylase-like protein